MDPESCPKRESLKLASLAHKGHSGADTTTRWPLENEKIVPWTYFRAETNSCTNTGATMCPSHDRHAYLDLVGRLGTDHYFLEGEVPKEYEWTLVIHLPETREGKARLGHPFPAFAYKRSRHWVRTPAVLIYRKRNGAGPAAPDTGPTLPAIRDRQPPTHCQQSTPPKSLPPTPPQLKQPHHTKI